MGLETDEIFQELYEEQYLKIPFIFRFSKKRFKVTLIILGVLIVLALGLIAAFYGTGEYVTMETLPGHEFGFNNYDFSYLIAFIFTMCIVVVVALWLVIGDLLQKRAFAKASRLANMIFLSERHRDEVRRQNNNLLKRY